jgi:hypothetical protein
VVAVSAVAKRIRARMEKEPFTIEGYSLMACYRNGTTGPFAEFSEETTYQHRPGIYLVVVEPTE